MVDEDKLNQLIGKMRGDLGGAFSVPTVRMDDRLGLYKRSKSGRNARRLKLRQIGFRPIHFLRTFGLVPERHPKRAN
jgi:hypothetical protein